jgi:hypothetical protein
MCSCLQLLYLLCQSDQVRQAEVRSARCRNDERIGSRQAGPAGRQKAHAAIRISVKDTILTELSILSR